MIEGPQPSGLPPSGSSVVATFVDVMQQGPKRRQLSSGIILAGDVISVFGAVVALYASLRGIKAQDPWVVTTGLILAVLIALSKTFKYYVEKRDKEIKACLEQERTQALTSVKESYDLGAADGANRVYAGWIEVARLHEDGMDGLGRQFHQGVTFQGGTPVGPDAVDSCLLAISNVFKAFYVAEESVFTVSIAIANRARTTLHLARIHPGGLGRSNPLPRPYALADQSWGMAESFSQDKIVYTPDVRAQGQPGNRGYLSVVNLPVRNSEGRVIAVVNVDSPREQAFGSEDRVLEVWRYCLPLLSSIALSLSDPRLFRELRS
ncbi:hypothetical protein [Deinococcus altitudinis]|uniref:hypothetical protein n=1 Tax=Deinococcus altitudinis TaxID=468914 RepID=UPI00389270AD